MTASLLLSACSTGQDLEAFCERARETTEAGPLFPDRTDGEPVPVDSALTALEEMASSAPGEIEDELDVLVGVARALVADAATRSGTTAGAAGDPDAAPPATRPSRAQVEAAQTAVVSYVAERCDHQLGG